MKEKIIELVEKLVKDPEFTGLYYSLTINYERLVNDFKPELFNDDGIIKIKSLLDTLVVKSFNFTLIDKVPGSRHDYNLDFEYDRYWYTLNHIFHGKKKIQYQFSFLAQDLSINQLQNSIDFNENQMTNIKELAALYRRSSKEIYEMFEKLKKKKS